MINNRVYEVLSSGTPLISDWFENLETVFDDLIKYVDVTNSDNMDEIIYSHLKSIISMGEEEREQFTTKTHTEIATHHTYNNRLGKFLNFYNEIVASRENDAIVTRAGSPKMLVLYNDDDSSVNIVPLKLMLKTLDRNYVITQKTLSEVINLPEFWAPYDFILVVDDFLSPVDTFIRSANNAWPRKWTTPRQTSQIRMIYHAGSAPSTNVLSREVIESYDTVFVSNSYDEEEFRVICEAHECGTKIQKSFGVNVIEGLSFGEVEDFILEEKVGSVVFENVVVVDKIEDTQQNDDDDCMFIVINNGTGQNSDKVKFAPIELSPYKLFLLLPRAKKITLLTKTIDAVYVANVLR